MIRRLLILVGVATLAVGGLALLSDKWQFGYVGSWGSIGLRGGKLWYVWRVAPISDGEGFYLDAASEVNRAMYNISMGARFREKPIGPTVLGVLAAVAYALILPPILRRRQRPSPQWLIASLVSMSVLLAALWTTSRIVNVTYYGPHVHLRLYDGAISANIAQQSLPQGGLWGKGWNIQRMPGSFINYDGYFSWRNGRIMMNLPLAATFVVLLVPAIVLAFRRRQLGPNHCRQCTYDLTGNLSGVCPECGTPIANAETQKAAAQTTATGESRSDGTS